VQLSRTFYGENEIPLQKLENSDLLCFILPIEHAILPDFHDIKYAMAERPQYFENTLALPSIDAVTLSDSLQKLRVAIRNGAQVVQENSSLPGEWGSYGLFGFFPGILNPNHRLFSNTIASDYLKQASSWHFCA
jgi:hypothetical protein